MKKRTISMLLCAALTIGTLTGCGGDAGGNENSTAGTNETNSVEQESDTSLKDSADSNAGGEKVKIEFFNQKSEIKDIMDEIVKEFNESHPDIEVEQVQVPDGGNVLMSRMSSGDMPDIAGIYPNESKFREYVDSGFFMDITGDACLSNLDTNVLDSVKYNGKDYSAPLTMNAYGIFYNVGKFKELGIEVPKSWVDLEAAVKKIKDSGYIPFATSLKEGWTVGHLSEAIVGNSMGVETASEFFLSDGKAGENAAFKKAAERFNLVFDNTEEDALGTDYNTAATLFATEEALMFPQGIWAAPVIEKAGAEFEYSMMPFPADAEGDTRVPYGVDFAVGISASTKHPEEAKEFVAYLASKDVAQKLHDQEKSPSVVAGVEAKNTETLGVTSYLDENKGFTWLHFEWLPANDADWQNMVSAYAATKDYEELTDTVDSIFGK